MKTTDFNAETQRRRDAKEKLLTEGNEGNEDKLRLGVGTPLPSSLTSFASVKFPLFASLRLCAFALICFCAVRAPAITPVTYSASDFTGLPLTNQVALNPVLKIQMGGQTLVASAGPIYLNPDTNGNAATNLVSSVYTLTIQGVTRSTLVFVPDTNVAQNLGNCVISNLATFSATNLNVILTNWIILRGRTNVTVTTNGFVYYVDAALTNLAGAALSPANLLIGNAASNAIPTVLGRDASLDTNGNLTLANTTQARADLGLGTAATQNTSAFAQTANNGSDFASKPSAAQNVGIYSTGSTDPYTVSPSYAGQLLIDQYGDSYVAAGTIAGAVSPLNPYGGMIEIGHPYRMPSSALSPPYWYLAGAPSVQTPSHSNDDNAVNVVSMNPYRGPGLVLWATTTNSNGTALSTNSLGKAIYFYDQFDIGMGGPQDQPQDLPTYAIVGRNGNGRMALFNSILPTGFSTNGNYSWYQTVATNTTYQSIWPVWVDGAFTPFAPNFKMGMVFNHTTGELDVPGKEWVNDLQITNTFQVQTAGSIVVDSSGNTQTGLLGNTSGSRMAFFQSQASTATPQFLTISSLAEGVGIAVAGSGGVGIYVKDDSAGSPALRIDNSVGGTADRVTIKGQIALGSASGPMILTGTGSPAGAVTAPVGSLYLRSDGGTSTTLYVKESGTGNSGWVAK